MEDIDTKELNEYDDEDMFLCDVCSDDHELLFLDSYLRETFRGHRAHRGTGGGETFGEEETL